MPLTPEARLNLRLNRLSPAARELFAIVTTHENSKTVPGSGGGYTSSSILTLPSRLTIFTTEPSMPAFVKKITLRVLVLQPGKNSDYTASEAISPRGRRGRRLNGERVRWYHRKRITEVEDFFQRALQEARQIPQAQ